MTIRLLPLLFLLTASCRLAPSDPRPNVLFVFSDDHAVTAVSAYGSRINRTPNLDRIANEGMLFRNAFVTNAICAPSRAVILTGKYSHLNGQLTNEETFDGSQQTFPKLLRAAGYQTALFGKWHLGSEPTGFDRWEVLIGQGPYYNPPMSTSGGIREHEGYTTDIITDLALEWLESERDASRPFLLMLQHKAPHRYWDPGPDHLTLYDDVTIEEPKTLFDDWSGKGTAAKRQTMTIAHHLNDRDLKLVPPEELTPEQHARWEAAYGRRNSAFQDQRLDGDDLVRWKYQRYVKDYLRTVASVDDNVGRVLDFLDASGLTERTIVVYASDQGWFLGEHGWFDKRFMYEESLRFPLLVRWPGVVEGGSESSAMVSNLDFAETFLDAAGVEVPFDMQGESLVPILKGVATPGWRRSFYYHYYEYPGWHDVARHYGIRTETHKLIHFYTLGEWELYDLVTDPDELQNVHADPANAELIGELESELERLRAHYRVPEDIRPIEDR
jgi:arylsulfatase A-like enzyme